MRENSEVIAFRADPKLANELRKAASTEAMSLSDYMRTICRFHLRDQRGTHSMGEPQQKG
jgi:hypothetical protein